MDEVYWGNSVMDYLMVIGGILLSWVVIRLLKKSVLKKLRDWISRTDNRYDDMLFGLVDKFILPYLYIVINYAIINQLVLHPKLERVLEVAMIVVSVFFFIRLLNHVLQVLVNGYMRKREESEERIRQLNGLLTIVKVGIWALGFIFLLDNLGYNVTTIIAGLGVGGIAVALAAQTILGDLFSYFSIFFDKPFEVGDFVVVNNFSGTIEHIGIKTTRVRALSGEQLIMSNSELTKATIQNFKRMQQRRVLFTLGVVYQTKREHLQEIPGLVRSIIERQEGILFDRAHLLRFADFSIDFEVVYIKLTADYNLHMNTQEAIMVSIYDEFKSRGIEFAYPTQTIYVQGDSVQAESHRQGILPPDA